jgi:zinc ribbon protein
MYCSSCGSPVTPGRSYCNRCGAELSGKLSPRDAETPNAPPFPEALVWAIVAVSVGGLGVLIGLMAVMKNALHFANGLIVAFSLASFFLLLAAEMVFIWLMVSSQRRGRERAAADPAQVKGSATKELAGPREQLLSEPAISVTEHTTRTLEPVYRERKTE